VAKYPPGRSDVNLQDPRPLDPPWPFWESRIRKGFCKGYRFQRPVSDKIRVKMYRPDGIAVRPSLGRLFTRMRDWPGPFLLWLT